MAQWVLQQPSFAPATKSMPLGRAGALVLKRIEDGQCKWRRSLLILFYCCATQRAAPDSENFPDLPDVSPATRCQQRVARVCISSAVLGELPENRPLGSIAATGIFRGIA